MNVKELSSGKLAKQSYLMLEAAIQEYTLEGFTL
jgi:hypothetical protein